MSWLAKGERSVRNSLEYAQFFEAYKSLIPRAYESLLGLRSSKTVAAKSIHQLKIDPRARKDPTCVKSYVEELNATLDSYLNDPSEFKFLTDTYQKFILVKIRNLSEVGVDWEACARWSSVYLILRKFILDSSETLQSYLPKNSTMTNGGEPSDSLVSVLRGFFSSNVILEPLVMKTMVDWDRAHLLALEDRIDDFQSEIQYTDIYDAVRYLRTNGFLKSKGYEFYEKLLGKETINLIREFVSIK